LKLVEVRSNAGHVTLITFLFDSAPIELLVSRVSKEGLSYTIQRTGTRYDTIYLRALKNWREGQLNLAHGTKTRKSKEKLKTKTVRI